MAEPFIACRRIVKVYKIDIHEIVALKGVDFDMDKGEAVAIIGPSGAGKSTIFNLLLRFYDAGSGAIAVDGQDIQSITLESLRGAIAVVTQEAAPSALNTMDW